MFSYNYEVANVSGKPTLADLVKISSSRKQAKSWKTVFKSSKTPGVFTTGFLVL